LALSGLNTERAPVFPGGVAILTAVFEALGLERMRVADSALREGLLYDLHGRIRQEDVREQTIAALSSRYHVDAAQAARVARTARVCLEQAARSWKLTDDEAAALTWAAQLHEIGLAVAHTQYHKHGAYLARHADLAGFSRTEQAVLAALIRAHRRKFPVEEFVLLPKVQGKRAARLALLLRLAVLLHRARTDAALPAFKLAAHKNKLELRFPRGWLEQHPLTQADLAQEAQYLRAARYRLTFA
jgi:exopolyphosphatase/guanosine-5'-triphosphate,3'-diphosphate pyrophosphatase